MTDRDSELRALLTLAGDWEARRLSAVQRKDWPEETRCEAELRKLWRRHSELEGRAA